MRSLKLRKSKRLPFRVLLVAVLALLVTVSSGAVASASTVKHHPKPHPVVKHHPKPINPYKIDWGACIISVIPIAGQAKYIVDFPSTLKKLQFVNVYESPGDLYLALKSFPFVHGACWPAPPGKPVAKPKPPKPQPPVNSNGGGNKSSVTCPAIPGGCPHPGDKFASGGSGVWRNGVSYGIPEGAYCENPPGVPGVIHNNVCYVGTAG